MSIFRFAFATYSAQLFNQTMELIIPGTLPLNQRLTIEMQRAQMMHFARMHPFLSSDFGRVRHAPCPKLILLPIEVYPRRRESFVIPVIPKICRALPKLPCVSQKTDPCQTIRQKMMLGAQRDDANSVPSPLKLVSKQCIVAKSIRAWPHLRVETWYPAENLPRNRHVGANQFRRAGGN